MTIEDPIVLLVDDSKNDAMLMRIVFERTGSAEPLRFAVDGDDAIAYLKGDGRYRDRKQFPIPTVILMDLNMPKKNGFEVLEWIRQQPTLKRMHVYILSASNRPEDIERAYDLGANSYLLKPGNLDGLVQMTECLVAWLKLSHFVPVNGVDESREPASAGSARVEHADNRSMR
jgi:CheY-like chemotaxis protein